jgi:radical SAM protein
MSRPPYRRNDFDHSPLIVFYELTKACDLVCVHCRARAQRWPAHGELSPAQSRLLVDQLGEFPRPPTLVLTGGDPLKRGDVFDLIRYGVGRGLDVSITPSPTPLLTRDAIRRLRGSGISRMAVSLDGADAATHDAVRGVVGNYERTRAILADALAEGVPLQVNTTVTRANMDQLDAMAELLARYAIALWSVFFLVPVGRAATTMALTAEECERVFARLWQQSQRQPYAIKTTEAPHYRRFVIQQSRATVGEGPSKARCPPQFGANDGRGILFVSHRGLIFPSGFLPLPCGSFPDRHVVDVYQNSPVFRRLRDANSLEGKCGRCEFRRVCGGSRARAFALTANPYAAAPDCVYEPAQASAALES